MKKATFSFFIICVLIVFDYLYVSKKEAINIVEGHSKENYKKLYINGEKLKIGKVLKVEERFSEDGTIPPQWNVELLTKEGDLFANYWINTTDEKFGYGLSTLAHEMLKPSVGEIVVTEERKLRFGETMNFSDFDATVSKQDENLNILIENKLDQELIVKIEIFGDTPETLFKTIQTKERLQYKLPLGHRNKAAIHDGRNNRAIWE